MTKVMLKAGGAALWFGVLAGICCGQKIEAAQARGSAESLYLGLRSVGLDSHRVYRIREAAVDRAAIHISLDNGTIAFSEDVGGRITGAFFKGDGEVLMAPPNSTERASLASFTGSPILEESFSAAYFRFNDELYEKLKPFLHAAADDAAGFVNQWNAAVRALAPEDALRLLISFTDQPDNPLPGPAPGVRDPFLHVFLEGNRLGTFDLRFDAALAEQICIGQHRIEAGQNYYDVWASFPAENSRHSAYSQPIDTAKPDVAITRLRIQARIKPPTELDAKAVLTISPAAEGRRVLLLELSRLVEVKAVRADGRALEFIHNQAIEGSQLARRGNDLIAVIFPAPLTPGRNVELSFDYSGAVLSEAANGLLYVGERGTWYPNQGFQMAAFDLEFRYPPGWTLVATGRRTQEQLSGGEQVSHWESERPIPVAGFNLGKYSRSESRAGQVPVVAYATANVERDFPHTAVEAAPAGPPGPGKNRPMVPPLMIFPKPQLPPSPSQNASTVAVAGAQALAFYQQRFGAFPFSELKLTQSPGKFSQGWPGLIFLSSYAFLDAQERAQVESDPKRRLLMGQVVAHETAHQWWGDLVAWRDYRDQWIMEALANYSSLMLLESKSPTEFHQLLEKFRDDLLAKNSKGLVTMNAGPVTLGIRLSSSQFPGAYEVISYERGTWLLHMLRTMLRDSAPAAPGVAKKSSDERFLRALARLRADYQGQAITTAQLIHLFEAELPPSVWYEGHRSLEWFYNSWVNGTAIPEFELKDVKLTSKVRGTTVSGTLVQDHSPPELVTSVPLYGSVAGKNVFIGRVFAEGHETQFRLSGPEGVRKIVIDPEQTLLARAK